MLTPFYSDKDFSGIWWESRCINQIVRWRTLVSFLLTVQGNDTRRLMEKKDFWNSRKISGIFSGFLSEVSTWSGCSILNVILFTSGIPTRHCDSSPPLDLLGIVVFISSLMISALRVIIFLHKLMQGKYSGTCLRTFNQKENWQSLNKSIKKYVRGNATVHQTQQTVVAWIHKKYYIFVFECHRALNNLWFILLLLNLILKIVF